MAKFFITLTLLFGFYFSSNAQKFTTGISFYGNFVQSHLGKSIDTESILFPESKFSFGIGIPVYYNINERVEIQSGLNYLFRQSSVSAKDFDFPNLTSTGGYGFSSRYGVLQLPLFISIKSREIKNKILVFSIGGTLSQYKPSRTSSYSDWNPIYTGGDTLFNVINVQMDNFETIYTPELSLGLGIIFKKKGHNFSRIDLAYQITLNSLNDNSIDVSLQNTTESYYTLSIFQPKLSTLQLSYTHYLFNKK